MGRFIVPLKFSDGDLVRNTEQLKKKFNSHYRDIVKFIEGGELERFFFGLARDDLKDLIGSMKREGLKRSDIAKKLASTLGVELNIDSEHDIGDGIVGHDDELKSVLEGTKTDLNFPAGAWKERNEINIKFSKKITGSGSDKTAFFVNAIIIDIPDGDVVEIESVTFKKVEGQELEGIIIIKNGTVTFKNTIFEGMRLIAKNKSNVKLINGLLAFTPASIKGEDIIPEVITIEDEAKVEIGKETKFEKIDNLIAIKFDDYPLVIKTKEVEQYGKYSDYIFSREYIDLWFKERLIEFSDYLAIAKHIKMSGKIELSKPAACVAGEFFVEGDGELIIEAKSGSAFYVGPGGSLQLKNVKILSATDVDSATLIKIDGGKLEIDGCEVRGCELVDCISANRSEVVIKTSVLDSGLSGISLKSSKAFITKSKIMNNKKYGVEAQESSTIKVSNCEIRQNGTSEDSRQMAIYNSELFMDNTIVADSVGCGILFKDSKGEILNCKVFKNTRRGVEAQKSSTIKVSNCEIRQNGASKYAQIGIFNSELFMDDTIVADSVGNGIYFKDSKGEIVNCKVFKNAICGVDARQSSTIKVSNCEIQQNGTSEYAQMWISNSELFMDNTIVADSVGFGIYFEDSKGEILNCKVFKHARRGVEAYESSTIKVSNCEIRQNGTSEYAQIGIFNSELFMDNTIVADSVGRGIVLEDSKGEILNCKVFKNEIYGVWIEKSIVKIKSCEMKDNSSPSDEYDRGQITIKNKSDVIINDTTISGYFYGIVFDDSTIAIDKCKLQGGARAIYCPQSDSISSINIKRSEILGYSPYGIYLLGHIAAFIEDTIVDSCWVGIEFYGDNLKMLRCTITNCESVGIRIGSNANVKIMECKVAQNKGPEIFFKSGTQIEVYQNCDVLIQKSEIRGGKKGYSIKSRSPIKAENSFIEGGIRYE